MDIYNVNLSLGRQVREARYLAQFGVLPPWATHDAPQAQQQSMSADALLRADPRQLTLDQRCRQAMLRAAMVGGDDATA